MIESSHCAASSDLPSRTILLTRGKKTTLSFSYHVTQIKYMSITSTLNMWYAKRNHSLCKCGTSFILTGKALLIDSLFMLRRARWFMGCWGNRNGSGKIFIRCEKGMSSNPHPYPHNPPCFRLRCSQTMFLESNLTSRVESLSFPLSYDKPHSSPILEYKPKRQESSETFPHVSVWFQTEVKGWWLLHADVSRHLCLFMI